MDKIMSIYSKIRDSRRSIPGAVSVLCVCLIAVVTLFFCLPETKAATEKSVSWAASGDGSYKLSALDNGDSSTVVKTTLSVRDNTASTPYIIDGDGVVGLNQSITINYDGGSGSSGTPAKVYITLKNVNIERTLDYEVIAFTTSSGEVDFVVNVEGDCSIKSKATTAEYKPLISIENITYDVLQLSQATGAGNSIDEYVTATSVERKTCLILGGTDPDATLELSYLNNGFGAVIGSRESVTLNAENSQTAASVIDSLSSELRNNSTNKRVYVNDPDLSDEIFEMGFTKIADGEFYIGYVYQQKYTAGAGKITIGGENGDSPLRLSILNEGYGAAIGGGAGSATANSASNADEIIINAGTLYINSTMEGVAAIGTGKALKSGAAAASVQNIEINGGSIMISSNGPKLSKNPVNSQGQRVYEIEVGPAADANGITISNIGSLAENTEVPIDFYPKEGLQLAENLAASTDSFAKKCILSDSSEYMYLDVMVAESVIGYAYQGTGHDGRDTLYFYLPATETTTLTINDEFGVGYGDDYVQYVIKDSQGRVVDPMSNDVTSTANRTYVLLKGEMYYLNATYIPNGLSIKNVTLTTNGANSTSSYDTNKGGYIIPTSSTSVSATVIYGGTIDIVYDDGFVLGDESNHNVLMPSTDYEYGTEEMQLADLGTIMKTGSAGASVPDVVFVGWMYTDASGAEKGWVTHITSQPKSGSASDHYEVFSDIIQPDGKIYLKAKWKIKIEYTIPTGDGGVPNIELDYGIYEPYYTYDVKIADYIPSAPFDDYSFDGWLLDTDEDTIYRYGSDINGTATVSTLTSHILHARYIKSGFAVYIDAETLSERYSELQCLRGIEQLLITNTDGTLATTVKDGKAYYYTRPLPDNTQIRVIMETASGYKMSNLSIVCSTANSVSTDDTTGECFVDFTINGDDVYITTKATFSPIEYEIYFKDGKMPNEYLWNGYHFTYDIEDVEAGKTIGDIIREGLGDSTMTDSDIANAVNTIDKNNRFTDFAGWTLGFVDGVLNTDAVIGDIISTSGTVTYGTLTFNANWMEYDKFAINVNLLERQFMEEGTFMDFKTSKVVPVLYYYTESGTLYPVYTETVVDRVTGDETTTAYAKAGDKIMVRLYRANANGKPMGEPLVEGIIIEELYYVYESKLDESVRADVQGGLQTFTVKDDVKDDTVIEVYMVFSPKQYSITYWDLRGNDNSVNPTTYTIFDKIDFVTLLPDVDWLLVCQDNDDTNDDDVTTEVIYGIEQGGKLVTDGSSSQRGYLSNLVIKPDWDDYKEEMYTIEIIIDGEVYGEITVSHPFESEAYAANETIVLSVKPKAGYQLVAGSLTYKKATAATPLSLNKGVLGRSSFTLSTEELPLSPVNIADGVYIFTMPSNDVVINASFEICQYSITYSDMTADIVNPNPEQYNINSSIVLEDAVREGYNFLGWYDEDGNRILKIANRTGDMVLTPMFQLIETGTDEPNVTPPTGDEGDEPSNNPSDNPNDGNDDEDNAGDNPGGITDGTGSDDNNNNNTNDKDDNDKEGISGRPSNVIINGSVTSRPSTPSTPSTPGKTGDSTDVPRLVLISVAAVLVLMIIVLKKKEYEKEA